MCNSWGSDDPDSDDLDSGDWEEMFAMPDPDSDGDLPDIHGDGGGDDDHADSLLASDAEYSDHPSDSDGAIDAEGTPAAPDRDPCIRIVITPAMWSEATQCAHEMDRVYGHKNDFGDDNGVRKQRRGVLGNMAFSQAGFGNWRRHREALPNQADFGMLDVKSSRVHHHRSLTSLHLIESESSPGIDPPRYPFYVQVFVDDVNRVAYVVGWCTGDELWSHGKTPIPRGGGKVGYQRPVPLLYPMHSLLFHWDRLDDGRWARFRPENLGL